MYKDNELDSKDKKTNKIVCDIGIIIAKIVRILSVAGIAISTIALIVALIIVPQITVNSKTHTMIADGSVRKYTLSEDNASLVIYKEGGNIPTLNEKISNSNLVALDAVLKLDVFERTAVVASCCVYSIVLALFITLICGKTIKFLKNIKNAHSPFIEDNIKLVKRAIQYLISIFAAKLILSIILFAKKVYPLNIDFTLPIVIMLLYVLVYIIKYGNKEEEMHNLNNTEFNGDDILKNLR